MRDMAAVVGGASRGLGAAIAKELVDEECRVALVARPSDELDARAQEIGGIAIGADLSHRAGPKEAIWEAVETLGRLDLLVVNSGGPPSGLFEELGEEHWDEAINGVLLSAVRLISAALPNLRESERQPAILVILSSSVREPIPRLLASNVLRPAVAGMVKALASEIAPVRINGLAPGRILTERLAGLERDRAAAAGITTDELQRQTVARIPAGRYGTPEEIGRVAAFLLSPAASYMTGQSVLADGGMVKALP